MSNNVTIHVHTQFIEEQSSPEEAQFVYAYTIRIENQGGDNVKLLSRKWIITDANEKVQEVEGEGVVGQQPVIPPGESFTYTSGAVIGTESGTMSGHYTMQYDDGRSFDADIPIFGLVRPEALH